MLEVTASANSISSDGADVECARCRIGKSPQINYRLTCLGLFWACFVPGKNSSDKHTHFIHTQRQTTNGEEL